MTILQNNLDACEKQASLMVQFMEEYIQKMTQFKLILLDKSNVNHKKVVEQRNRKLLEIDKCRRQIIEINRFHPYLNIRYGSDKLGLLETLPYNPNVMQKYVSAL
jgi:hypothetical protein